MPIVAFEPDHLAQMELRPFDLGCAATFGEQYAQFVTAMAGAGPAFSLEHKGKIVACAGVVVLWPGVGEGWMVTDNSVHDYPISFHKATIRGLQAIIDEANLHRVQVAVHEQHKMSHKWVQRLGFEPEGMMRAYGPEKANYVRYARVTEWLH